MRFHNCSLNGRGSGRSDGEVTHVPRAGERQGCSLVLGPDALCIRKLDGFITAVCITAQATGAKVANISAGGLFSVIQPPCAVSYEKSMFYPDKEYYFWLVINTFAHSILEWDECMI